MKKTDIRVGKTYCNKTGNSAREVLAVRRVTSDDVRNGWHIKNGDDEHHIRPRSYMIGEEVVVYTQRRGPYIGTVTSLSLLSFATWANREDDGAASGNGKVMVDADLMANLAGALGLDKSVSANQIVAAATEAMIKNRQNS